MAIRFFYQEGGKIVTQRRTVYPAGVAVTLDLEYRPIHLILSEDNKPVTYVMITGVPIIMQVNYRFNSFKKTA